MRQQTLVILLIVAVAVLLYINRDGLRRAGRQANVALADLSGGSIPIAQWFPEREPAPGFGVGYDIDLSTNGGWNPYDQFWLDRYLAENDPLRNWTN